MDGYANLLILILVLVLVIATIVVGATIRKNGSYITVFAYERGLKYVRGCIAAVLEPGRYWCWKSTTTIVRVDMRSKSFAVPNQEILTKDGIPVKISLLGTYRVADPQQSVMVAANTLELMYAEAQRALRAIVAMRTVEEILTERETYGSTLLQSVGLKANELGLLLESISVRDLILSGEYKRALANLASARTAGLASLERARGETASLRNLANAARLIDDSPNLLPLRMLQALGESSGNTVVFGAIDAAGTRRPAKNAAQPPEDPAR